MSTKRDFITLLAGAAAWPLAARAQQPAMPLVGLLTGSRQDDRWLGALRQGLKEAGYIEGRNVAIKHRSGDGHFDRVPQLAAELVADPVTLIIAIAPSAALAAKAATVTIPIVFVTGADPVELGLVSSLSRPDGNVTGVNFLVKTLAAKRLELLRELVPGATLIGFLVNPDEPGFRTRDKRRAGRVARTRAPASNPAREQRTRYRNGLRELRSTAYQCHLGCRQFVFLEPKRSTDCGGGSPCDSRRVTNFVNLSPQVG